MASTQTNNNRLPSNLPQLQNLIKRDAASYAEEFERQHTLYEATCVIFEQNPTVFNKQLYELIMFLAQVAQCYPDHLKDYPQELMTLLKHHATVLHPEMRLAFVKALVLLRNKNMLAPTDLHLLFFQLLHCQDKNLRKFLQQHIVTDIKNINSKSKNMKLNKELQNFMFDMMSAKHAVVAKTSLNVLIELYNKRVWNDAKTVNIIASACFSKVTKIMVAAVKFFLGKDDEEEEEDSDSDGEYDNQVLKSTSLSMKVNKKTKKIKAKVEKAKATVKKNKKKTKKNLTYDFSALHLVRDPQEMAEKLYRRLEKMNERFEVKLMTMNLISRLIGVHGLYLPNFYPLVQRFLFPHQREVTKVMVFAAQAAHPLVPPDDLEPVVRCLANNFVSDHCNSEVMAMGLNAIRELCLRNPHGMSEDLLQDLAQYKSHKDKGVMMASRSLISLYRDKNPELLAKKDRGAPTELLLEKKQQQYGETNAMSHIPGAEILAFKTSEEPDEGIGDSSSDDSDDEDLGDAKESYDMVLQDEDSEGETDDRPVMSQKEAVKEVLKLTAEERTAKASEIVSSRFLTDSEFAKIAAVQAAKQVQKFSASSKRKSKKRKREEAEDIENRGEIVSLKNIEMIYKKRKHDKESRLGTREKPEEKPRFGKKKGRMNPNASTTNREKKKTKNYMMLKHKIAGKQKQSFREKQIKLRNALLKQRKNY